MSEKDRGKPVSKSQRFEPSEIMLRASATIVISQARIAILGPFDIKWRLALSDATAGEP